MTKPKHLPECFNGRQRSGGLPCICDRLRDCEQRILLSKPNIELSALYGYEAGRVDGINEARDAVAASGGHSDRCICDECYGTAAALAAIDALKESK